jgi:hypothetical protein
VPPFFGFFGSKRNFFGHFFGNFLGNFLGVLRQQAKDLAGRPGPGWWTPNLRDGAEAGKIKENERCRSQC